MGENIRPLYSLTFSIKVDENGDVSYENLYRENLIDEVHGL